MNSWKSGSHDLKLKNGKVVKEYFLKFKTTNWKEVLYLDSICQDMKDGRFHNIILGEEE